MSKREMIDREVLSLSLLNEIKVCRKMGQPPELILSWVELIAGECFFPITNRINKGEVKKNE